MKWATLDSTDEGRCYWAKGEGGRRYSLTDRDGCWQAFEHRGIGDDYQRRLILEGRTGDDSPTARREMVEAWERVWLEADEGECDCAVCEGRDDLPGQPEQD